MTSLIDQTTRHAVMLERLKSGEVAKFEPFLRDIDRSIRKRLSVGNLTEFSRKRLNRLLIAIENDLSAVLKAHSSELMSGLREVASYEAEFEARSLSKVLVNVEATIPTASQVSAAILSAPMSVRGADGGKLLKSFITDWSDKEIERVTGAIRQGAFEGQTNSQILRAIRGTRANKYRDGILAITDRHAASIIRTSVQHIASTARAETWKANSNLIKSYQWISTLDGKTTAICQNLDSRVFKVGAGPVPPAHINCRSVTTAVLDERFDFLKDGATRASKGGQVSASLTYYDWLKQQPVKFQNSAIGIRRARILRAGGLSSEEFAKLSMGRNFKPITLKEMRKLEPEAFEKAGL